MTSGDILAVRGSSWLSKRILAATGNTVSHVGLIIATEPIPTVIEALTRVRTRPLDVSIATAESAWVLTDTSLTDDEREAIIRSALNFSADGYGYGDILLQGMNALTKSTWWTDHLAFGLAGKPICSYLVAAAYETQNRTFGQLDKTTTPADIYNFARSHPAYKVEEASYACVNYIPTDPNA